MGQGRKKCARSENSRYRHRSIPYEVENQDTTLSNSHGVVMLGRTESSYSHYKSDQREATPLPSLFRPIRRDSLAEYVQIPSVTTGSVFVNSFKDIVNSSPVNIFQAETCLPLISTSSSVPQCEISSEILVDESLSITSELLLTSMFPGNIVYMNGKGRDISKDMFTEIGSILMETLQSCNLSVDITALSSCSIFFDRVLYEGHKEIVRRVFSSGIDRVFASLINGCRFENIYGMSSHCTLLMGLCSCLPETTIQAHRVLYETLIDFDEAERESCISSDDDIYYRDTQYGQVHRLVELWQCFVNSFYEKYSTYKLAHKSVINESSLRIVSVRPLYLCLFVLLRVTDVTSKYQTLILSGTLKLFFIDPSGLADFVHVVIAKWPVGSSKRAVAMLGLIENLLSECQIFLNPSWTSVTTRLIEWICHLVNDSQAEVAMKALQILDCDKIFFDYIIHDNQRVRMAEQCLDRNQYHWNEEIRETGDNLFDRLLDYV